MMMMMKEVDRWHHEHCLLWNKIWEQSWGPVHDQVWNQLHHLQRPLKEAQRTIAPPGATATNGHRTIEGDLNAHV